MSKRVTIYRMAYPAAEPHGAVSVVAVGEGLEYHGEWMQHGYVTVTVNSATEIAFAVGDFVEFAGRKFYLWDEESVKKQARSGSYGEAYVYDNIKLHEGTVALEQVSMHDVVLEDNGQTYSSLSRFSFFGATVDDLADRIQANLVRQSTAIGGDTLRFRLFTPDKTRTKGRMSNMGNVGTAWESYYTGNEATGKKDVAVSIQNETLWGALGHAYNDFELPYYVASSNENDVDYIDIVIGGKAVEVSNSAFVYGKGHGLYEIERSVDSDQRIVTKLFAYGSTENLPTNYYGNLYKVAYADCLQSDTFVIDGGNYYFVDAVTGSGILWSSVKDALGVRADVRPSPFSIGGHTPVGKSVTVRCNNTNYTASIWVYETGGEQYLSFKTETQAPVVSDTKFYILDGVDLLKWPNLKIETASGYPGGMAIMNLMLPGFPKVSLADWVDALPAGNATKVRATNYVLSDEETDPWIQSANAAVYGIREGEVYFDGTDDRENIRPSIENTDFGTVASVTGITDDGWVDKTDGFVIKVLAANGGGDFWQAVWNAPHDDEVPLTMTSGYHNGREFKLTKVVVGATYVELSVDRIQDESGRWVPNTEQPIVGRDLPTPQHDTFVVTGIQLPKEYIDAASEKLLMAAFDELDKIDHGLRTYQPRLDEIYMANEQETADIESRASLHDTLRAGMVLKWQWEDYGTQGATVISSTIDVLTIKEDGNNGVPTYDVVLRDEKEKSLTEKIATVVSKTTGIGGGTAVRSDGGNADTAKKADRLSGDDEVTAWGHTYWQDGRPQDVSGSLEGVDDITMTGDLNLGNTGMGIDKSGDAVLNSVTIAETTTTTSGGTETTTEDKAVLTEDGLVVTEKVDNTVTKSTVVDENGMTIGTYAEGLFGTGGVFKMINGKAYLEADNLYVRMKAYFDTLEIRRYIHSGGNRVASAAGVKLSNVAGFVWITILGVKTARLAQDGETADFYRCLFRASDGDNEITNDFEVGDLAYCHTTNLAGSGQDTELNQKHYWRLVIGKGSITTDGVATEHYIDLSNAGSERVTIDDQSATVAGYMTGSDEPSAEDDVVQLGNVNNPTRRGAIVEAVSGAGCAPTYRIYQGLGADKNNLYTFTSPKVDMGYDMGNAKAYLNVFGNFYVGAEGNNPSTYVRYTQGDGQTQPLLEIKAKIDATSGSPILNTINEKNTVYTCTASDMDNVDYQEGDLWILPANNGTTMAEGTVLVCVRDKDGSYTQQDWAKKDRYTDDTAFNNYITQVLYGTSGQADSEVVAQAMHALKVALNQNTTIEGGLVLTQMLALKNENGYASAGIRGGSSGTALWLGGPMIDHEASPLETDYAKSLFRFDGSGYLAGGNISWEDDGDTEVKGTIMADNFFHKVCVFREGGTYFNGKSFGQTPTTGDADIVYLVPATINAAWQRSYTDERAAQESSARTIKLPPPSEYPGKTVEFFIFSYGDADDPQSSGIGYEKEIIIQAYGQAGIVGTIRYDADNDQIVAGSTSDTITVRPKRGYVRFQSMEMNIDGYNAPVYGWVFSTGYGEGGGITMINPTIADGAAEEWVINQISNWFEYDNGDPNAVGGKNEVVRANELNDYALSANIPTKTSNLINDSGFVTNAALSGFVTSARFGSGTVLYPSDGLLTLPEFMATSERGNYLPLTGGEVESLTVTNGLDADSITVSSLVNSNTLAEYLDADAMQTWLQQQGYITQTTADGRYIKGVSVYGSPLKPDDNRVVNIPYADINTPGVIQIGTGLVNSEGHTEVDTSVIASRSWANGQFVTVLGVSGDNLTYTKNGAVTNLTVPFATRTMGFKRLNVTGSQIADANTMTVGGVEYALLSNYNSANLWQNMPSGMSYGCVLQFTGGAGGDLAGQLAWDVIHGVTTGVTRNLYWRARNGSGWGHHTENGATVAEWKRIAFADELSGYLPLTAGSGKSLTGSLYVTPGAGTHQTVEIDGSLYKIGLAIGSGNTNRGLYGQTIGGSDNWLLYFDANNTILNYGNVGIGTNSPNYKLEVAGTFKASSNASVGGYLDVTGDINTKGTYNWTDGSNFELTVMGAEAVENDANDARALFYHRPKVNGTEVALMSDIGGGYLPLSAGSGNALTGDLFLQRGKHLIISGRSTINVSESGQSVFDPNYFAYLEIGTGFTVANYRTNIFGNQITFKIGTNSTEGMRITADGNVGIGTTSPAYKLDVNGSAKVSGDIYITGSLNFADGNFPVEILHGVTGDADYAIARFGLRPQVKDGSDWLDVVVAKSDENGIEFRGSEDGTYTFGNGNVRGDIYAGGGDFTSAIEATSYNFRGTADASGHGGASISHKSNSSVEGLVYYAGNRSGQHYFKAYNSNGNEMYANIHCLTCDETSDIRKKEVVKYLNPSVYDIAKAPIIKFRWKDGGNDLHLGSISQYWERTLPETVHIGDDLMQSMEKSTIALLAGITAARKAVDNERRIAELELRVAELEGALAAMVSQQRETTYN